MGFDVKITWPSERERYDDEPTAARPLALALAEFQCPVCHTHVTAQDVRGSLRIPWHRIHVPTYPFGLCGPMHRAECPASLMTITEICDGDHPNPRCSDPQCCHRVPGEELP